MRLPRWYLLKYPSVDGGTIYMFLVTFRIHAKVLVAFFWGVGGRYYIDWPLYLPARAVGQL
jgi:hypothetical protein